MATPLYCRKCGVLLPAQSPFCPACGASQSGFDHSPTKASQELSDTGTGRLPPGRMLHDRYRLLQAVGQGGMGAVYVAQDTQLGDRLVAVKEMSMSRLTPQELPLAVEQFKREAHLLASLQHPHLPIIYEYFGAADRWYLVMSFIEGGTLQAYLNSTQGNKLSVNQVVRIGIELCDVLDYLHTHQPQVIFRDLKPSNIMYTPKEQVYLIDFGIARHFKQDQAKDTAYYYSAGYAPPEQYGQSQTGPRSDIYSLGACLHQMLSGHNPASKPFQFPALQLLDPTIPVPLAQLVAQMLEMNEQQRPASVVEVKEKLEKVLKPEPIEATRKADLEQRKVSGTNLTWQSRWSNVNAFFVKRRVIAWLCFIVLSLILSVPTGFFLQALEGYSGYNHGWWLNIAGIGGAVVGLIFLLRKGRSPVDSIGGIVLALLGNLALLTFLSPTVASCGFKTDHTYMCDPFSFNLQIAGLSHAPFVFFTSILLLLLGTRFFLRTASVREGLIFGACLVIAGIIVSKIVQSSPLYNNGLTLAIPNIGSALWIPSVILGVAAIFVSLVKRQRNMQSVQGQVS